MDNYSRFIATSRYCRWVPELNRRETWSETVNRYADYMAGKFPEFVDDIEMFKGRIERLDVMPSMRALMTAGPALERCNVAGYNCAYLPIDNVRCFDETLYVLMCGTGVGFSVERQFVDKLPVVNEHFERTDTTVVVQDSKAGWARALREVIAMLYAGQIPQWDVSNVRPAGARLKTFGGRASGPAPLVALFEFCVELFTSAKGRRLKPIEAHDLVCKIAEIVVVGGVRRSALISLSDLDDYDMARAKAGSWWEDNPQRALANNSAVYNGRPGVSQYLREWRAIYDSKSGERGIFNRDAITRQAQKNGRRNTEGVQYGTNPCSEIILKPFQFCNLTEVVVRADDTEATLREKVDAAVMFGTLQAALTDFKYLRKVWKNNCEEERLLGVSLTGIYDNYDLMFTEGVLDDLRAYAVERNALYASSLGIAQSVAVTCVKPSGTVSQLVNSASGLHPRHSRFYIRTVRGDIKDPLTQLMIEQGVPNEPDVMKPDATAVFSFPVEAPEGVMTREDITAVQHLRDWLYIQERWCEHKPSVTINVREEEWPILGGEIFRVFDRMTGVALLPYSDHVYQQAPYQEVDEATYRAAAEAFPNVDWDALEYYETEDHTKGSQTLACVGGQCDYVDLTEEG